MTRRSESDERKSCDHDISKRECFAIYISDSPGRASPFRSRTPACVLDPLHSSLILILLRRALLALLESSDPIFEFKYSSVVRSNKNSRHEEMAPLVEAFPAHQLEHRIQTTVDGKRRKTPLDLSECKLMELIQYSCNLKGPVNGAQSRVVCEPIVRLFRRYVFDLWTHDSDTMSYNQYKC